ncbi:MAG: DUF333 domain-containing protein [Paracoccus sp. (in: a-proteobacteria)]|uniref:putative hemolysin n=1 Tax=Paracoccus sp. TaxID=267 RepID=UPI0026DF3281|nr:DUF333 domain-containing protein [Paracoccus sp. (in: a-proteobacteria)]MDO5620798.1 DUF333 domain-containing protein [Paracoccus sp. (in: a-proteobacteria)]
MLKTLPVFAVLALGACVTEDDTNAIGMANPASVYCAETLGGQSEIRDEAAGQVGYCRLPDGRVFEEWALFRGEIPGIPGAK